MTVKGKKYENLSKFLTMILRHVPDEFGLALNERHWCKREEVYQAVEKHFHGRASKDEISFVLLNSKWQANHRFDVWKGNARAACKQSYHLRAEDESDAV